MEVREPRKQTGGSWVVIGVIVVAFAVIATISGIIVRNFNSETKIEKKAANTEKVAPP